MLLTCSYKEKEFVRVGYYVNNEYSDSELRENPPARPILEMVSCKQCKLHLNQDISKEF